MQSCANVVMNRVAEKHSTPYAEVYRPLQFSSMSYQHDPQLLIQPEEDDPQWEQAQQLAALAASGRLVDITNGATAYYALSMAEPPYWASSMQYTVTIAGQKFFRQGRQLSQ